jgi:hypothetical protein
MSIIDLNTGAALVDISLESLGLDYGLDYFHHNAFSYNNGEEILFATGDGHLLCFKLPF